MSPTIRFYRHLLIRRAPAMLLLFLLSTVAGLMLATGLPATFSSQARLLVQGQAISEDLAASTVQIAALEEVQLLREQVMTRANLIEIATTYDVFEDIRKMTPDQVFGSMRAATTIKSEGGNSRRSGPSPVLVTVSFGARSGQIAADVVNEYVTRILAANVRLRTGQAGETLSFFEREVERLSDELGIRSARITEFQRANADAMPNDQEFRLQRQALLQERIAGAERERRALLETRQRTIEVFAAGATPVNTELPPDQLELQAAQEELDTLLLTFSESAPQVQNLQRRIKLLERRSTQRAGTAQPQVDQSEEESPVDPILALRLAEIDTQVEAIDVTLAEANAKIEELSDAISRAPLNAIKLQRLERDYDNVQLQFENARRSLARASIGERLEAGGRGQRITILEPPVVPSKPTSPDRRMLAAGGAGAGLFLAAALFVLLELLNRTVRRPAEITKALGISPFVTLPNIETARSRLLRRTAQVMAVLVLLVGVPAGLWVVHSNVIPLDELSQQLLVRLGLT
ncbi:MAG: lipopolysaccharide biosynthesis [Paracoccaceae bacterium]